MRSRRACCPRGRRSRIIHRCIGWVRPGWTDRTAVGGHEKEEGGRRCRKEKGGQEQEVRGECCAFFETAATVHRTVCVLSHDGVHKANEVFDLSTIEIGQSCTI